MIRKVALMMCVALALAALLESRAMAGADEVRKVQSAIDVLNEVMAIPETAIPPSLLADARGIAVIPGMLKASFFFGGRYGQGVLVVRGDDGQWSNPNFVKLIGGSFGFQFGAQSTDVILVFKTKRSIDAITSGKFTLGADASVAAGPVGRHAEAATDIELRAEIYSYSRSRGLFAGVSLEGASLQIDYVANSAFYDMAGLLPVQIFWSKDLQAPPVAYDLRRAVSRYTNE